MDAHIKSCPRSKSRTKFICTNCDTTFVNKDLYFVACPKCSKVAARVDLLADRYVDFDPYRAKKEAWIYDERADE
jgi:Zn finger protein HypA/HybF involved in hydrogenase expression